MTCTRSALAGILALLLAAPAAAQVNLSSLPPSTVVGRLGVSTGPAQAIPFTTLKAQLGISTLPSITYDVRDYAVGPKTPSTVCNGTGDDTATIQAAVNAAATNVAGRIIFPNNNCLVSSPGIDLSDKYNLILEGQGGGNPFTNTRARITYTSATGNLLKLNGANGIDIGNLEFYYNNASYNGDLIDLRQSGLALTTKVNFHEVVFSGTPGSATAANSLLRLGGTIDVRVQNGFLQYATRGVHNSGSEGAANSIIVQNMWFQFLSSQPLTMAGNGWSVRYNSVEPVNGLASNAAWIVGTGKCIGCDISNNNIGDANATGTWMDFTGGALIGGTITANVVDTGLHSINLGSSKDVWVSGNWFGMATDTGAILAASATQATIKSNSCLYGSPRTNVCATVVSGTLPANSEVYNADATGTSYTGTGMSFPTGFTLNWGSGDVTIQEGANLLSFGGASVGGYTFDFTVYPATNRAGSLGTATNGWADLYLGGSTSGIAQLKAPASGGATLTLPSATDTLIGKATTDTLTNKTFDTAGTGNSLLINGVAANANTGTGALARATSPSFTTPAIGAATGTSLKLGGSTMTADLADDKGGGDVFAYRFNSSNPRMLFGIGASSGSAFFGYNLVFSSGNVWNIDQTGPYWFMGDPGGSGAFVIGTGTGTAGNSADTGTGNKWRLRISAIGHIFWPQQSGGSAAPPTLSSCGTTPAIDSGSSDTAGIVTMGTGSPTSCTITFTTAYATSAPSCVVTWQTNLASMQYTVSTTAITLTQTATSSNKVNYHCFSMAN